MRPAAAVVAVVAWAGLAVQLHASVGQTGTIPAALGEMLRYFTVIANLAVALVLTAVALGRAVAAWLVGGVLLAILLVGIVYALLLRGLLELSGGAWVADLLLHSVTPVLMPLWWFMFAPKRRLARRDLPKWVAWPVAYFIYGLARGALDGRYPYPFMNPDGIGWSGVAAYGLAMAAGFLIAGWALIGLDRRLGRKVQALTKV